VSLNAKIFKIIYRLTLPGGLLLIFAAVLIRVGILSDPDSPVVRYVPLAIFAIGLGLSAFFRRSRLFFATLVLALSEAAFIWVAPFLSVTAAHTMVTAFSFLLPLNLVAIAFIKERGTISRTGRKRLAIGAIQIIAIAILCVPIMAPISAYLGRPFMPLIFTGWSHLTQATLASFILSFLAIMVTLVQRYRAVESGLFWSLISSFAACRLEVGNHFSGIFFATGGLALIVAVIETSYSMAYLDELTQLPSRRALNEEMMKLPETFTIAMFDVDHFKNFNDSYGHESGDQALRMVSSRLARIAGGGKAYRYGGEEFAVVFPGKPAEDVFVYLDRMRKIIEQSSFTVRGKERRGKKGKARIKGGKIQTSVTVSIGVASTNGDSLTPTEVMRLADQGLYRAKAKGRNCTIAVKSGKAPRAVETGLRIVSVS
jgi:diguanylate cyclase (GGDEF)-like protein